MDFMDEVFFTEKGKKGAQYSNRFRKFKKAIARNPGDEALRAEFIKFCLSNHFTLEDAPEAHLTEALEQYEEAAQSDHYDPQVYYLVGRYWQDKNDLKAQKVYLAGVKHFNRYVEKNPALKADYVELAYALALNFLTHQYGQIHPDLDKFFKTIRKSYPLLNKRVELENELRKSPPDRALIKQLTQELRELKEITDEVRTKRRSKS